MRRMLFAPCILLLAMAQYVVAADAVDVRRGVPEDVYMIVYGKHNPERDFQRKYYEDVWKTVQETQIIDDVIKIVTSQMDADDVTAAKNVIDELREAAKPIDFKALANAEEVVYAQSMQMSPIPTSQHLVIVHVTPEAAASTAEGVRNLFTLVEKYTNGQIALTESKEGEASVYGLSLPPQSPMQPAVAQLGNLFVFCTSKDMLEKSLQMLADGKGTSKFDDPRLKEALAKLPEMEDSMVFFDGKALFTALRGLGSFMQTMAAGDPNVERVAKILDKVWDDVGIYDYEVTVEYTDGNLNRTAAYGKLLPNTEDATLRKMLSGQSFEKWYGWVPAGALSYTVSRGVNLHPLYERIMSILKEDVPESAQGLEQFEAIQNALDVHLDEDILQAFPGEHVAVTLPATNGGQPQTVIAFRCEKPDRIKELINRGMEALQNIDVPQIQAQNLKLEDSKDLEGFQELSAAMLSAFQVRPVIGFQDGWMFVGSSAKAVKQVLDAKAGEGKTIESTEAFQKLKLDVEGPVESIVYTNTAENTHNLAQAVNQIGFMAPMIMAAAGANASPEDLKPVQEILGLLPDVARIINAFDFLEANVSVTQAGDEPGTYTKHSVTVVRPAEEK